MKGCSVISGSMWVHSWTDCVLFIGIDCKRKQDEKKKEREREREIERWRRERGRRSIELIRLLRVASLTVTAISITASSGRVWWWNTRHLIVGSQHFTNPRFHLMICWWWVQVIACLVCLLTHSHHRLMFQMSTWHTWSHRPNIALVGMRIRRQGQRLILITCDWDRKINNI